MTAYVRKIPIKHLFPDEECVKINKFVYDVNEVIRHTYQFIRLYCIYNLENSLDIPIIDKEFCAYVQSLISTRRANKKSLTPELRKSICEFHMKHYAPIVINIPNGKNMSSTIQQETDSIIQKIETHIKTAFHLYISRLAKSSVLKKEKDYKKQRWKLREDLYNGTHTSNFCIENQEQIVDEIKRCMKLTVAPKELDQPILCCAKNSKDGKDDDLCNSRAALNSIYCKTHKAQVDNKELNEVSKSIYAQDAELREEDKNYRIENEQCAAYISSEKAFCPMEIDEKGIYCKKHSEPNKPFPLVYLYPQQCLPLLFRLNKLIEIKEGKMLAFLPLKRSLIPGFITLGDKSFSDIKLSWKAFRKAVNNHFKVKTNYTMNLLKTDGVDCSIVFMTKTKKDKPKPELYLKDAPNKEELQAMNCIANDPGMDAPLTLTDGEKVLRYTQKRRRRNTRKTGNKKIRSKLEEQYKPNDLASIAIQNELSHENSKSCTFEKFKQYCIVKENFASRFLALYQQTIYRKLRSNSKINMRRDEDQFINEFRQMYGPPSATFIVTGDWEQSGLSFGKEPTKGKGMRTLFRKHGYKVFLIDEFRTSKLCCCCHGENEYNFMKRPDPRPWKNKKLKSVWGLVRCKNVNCSRIQQRDFNSCFNIHYLARLTLENKPLPAEFQRGNDIQGIRLAAKQQTSANTGCPNIKRDILGVLTSPI